MLKLTATITSAIAMSAMLHAAMPPVHDPTLAKGENGRYYIFSTGMGIKVFSSPDMKEWRREHSVFPMRKDIPQWSIDSVPGYHGHIWAPDISFHDGRWLLYYSCSTFGKNNSVIGLATNKTLDSNSPDYKWEDQGMVIKSHKHHDNWNAIDPNLVVDSNERILVYGSFWDGIQLVKLDTDFQTPVSKPRTIARRHSRPLTTEEMNDVSTFLIEAGDTIEAGDNAIEAPFIMKHGRYYYLFVSFDYCCRGHASTYKTVYGRSEKVEGPYYDNSGKPMLQGGGTLLFGPDKDFYGIGHCAVYNIDGRSYFVSHAYDKHNNGEAKLFIREIKFDNDGWINH